MKAQVTVKMSEADHKEALIEYVNKQLGRKYASVDNFRLLNGSDESIVLFTDIKFEVE